SHRGPRGRPGRDRGRGRPPRARRNTRRGRGLRVGRPRCARPRASARALPRALRRRRGAIGREADEARSGSRAEGESVVAGVAAPPPPPRSAGSRCRSPAPLALPIRAAPPKVDVVMSPRFLPPFVAALRVLPAALALLAVGCGSSPPPEWAAVREVTPDFLLAQDASQPALAADEHGRVALTWVTRDTSGSDLWLLISTDAG